MNWQSIETAPKDGTWVLLKGGFTTEDDYMKTGVLIERPVVAFWKIEEYINESYWAYTFWYGRWRDEYINPTHWISLEELSHG